MNATGTRLAAGVMTGTSLDGADAALVRLQGHGRTLRADCLFHHAEPFEPGLRERLKAMADGEPASAADFAHAGRSLGSFYTHALARLFQQATMSDSDVLEQVALIACHGQTVWHEPPPESTPPPEVTPVLCSEPGSVSPVSTDRPGLSWQLFDPWPVARRFGVPVGYDLRGADLIAGGQGAPITPTSDPALFTHRVGAERYVVANLGGVCNLTWAGTAGDPKSAGEPGSAHPVIAEGSSTVFGRDVGPCNLLLDGLSAALFGRAYDEDGRLAQRGAARPAWVERLRGSIDRACAGHGSLGREQFSPGYASSLARDLLGGSPDTARESDRCAVLASAVDAAAQRIVEACGAHPPWIGSPWVLAGGGVRNAALVSAIRQAAGVRGAGVRISDELGVPAEAREAAGFAVLGAMSLDGVPITHGGLTGADRPGAAGAWVNVTRPGAHLARAGE
ncbi:MAG: anhydro-N-acetylmuramic acid kinase [Planctomycetota bacterium]